MAGDHVNRRLREVIARRVDGLSPACRRVLTCAALLGREFDVGTLERMADVPVAAALAEAVLAEVLTPVTEERDRMRFSHALIRDALYVELPPASLRRLHLRAAEAIEARHADVLGPHLAELALHFSAACSARAAGYAYRAAEAAGRALAFEEAVRFYRLALASLDRSSAALQLERTRFLRGLAAARRRLGSRP